MPPDLRLMDLAMAKNYSKRFFRTFAQIAASMVLVGGIAGPGFGQGWQSGDGPKKNGGPIAIKTWEERFCDQPRFKNLPACFTYCTKNANVDKEACLVFVLNRRTGS